jgi:hypothetical protein
MTDPHAWRRAALEAIQGRRPFSIIATRERHKPWSGQMTALAAALARRRA